MTTAIYSLSNFGTLPAEFFTDDEELESFGMEGFEQFTANLVGEMTTTDTTDMIDQEIEENIIDAYTKYKGNEENQLNIGRYLFFAAMSASTTILRGLVNYDIYFFIYNSVVPSLFKSNCTAVLTTAHE